MTATQTHEPPTSKQLAYLRALARKTGIHDPVRSCR